MSGPGYIVDVHRVSTKSYDATLQLPNNTDVQDIITLSVMPYMFQRGHSQFSQPPPEPSEQTHSQQQCTTPRFSENNFGDLNDRDDIEDSILNATINCGFPVRLSGWNSVRQSQLGFVRKTSGTAYAEVSGLESGKSYEYRLYGYVVLDMKLEKVTHNTSQIHLSNHITQDTTLVLVY